MEDHGEAHLSPFDNAALRSTALLKNYDREHEDRWRLITK